MKFWRRLIAALCLACLGPDCGAAADAVTHVNTYGDWALLTDTNAPHLFCFLTSEAKVSTPENAEREAPRAYISAWPKDGIRGEISFSLGFPMQENAEATASVGPNGYTLFTTRGRAFVKDPTQELKLLDAMRKGHSLTIVMAPDGGASVTDTYSLSGVGLALQKLQETCF